MTLIPLILAFAAQPACADAAPYPPLDERAPIRAECLSENADGTRFLGRQVDEEHAFEESLYQCYLHTDELRVRSCRVLACRSVGGQWRGFP